VVEKVFEKRFGLKEKTLLPLHPAAEIKRVSSWKKGGRKKGVGKGILEEITGLKREKKNFKKKFGWNEKKPLPLQPERRVREDR